MIKVRNKGEIFHVREDWFEGYWHFSFGGPQGFFDPENTSFGTLRVFNVDTLVPGAVWPLHPHQDIEVITYALDPGKGAAHELELGYGAYLYVARGRVELEGHSLAEGAAAKIVDEPLVEIRAAEESELAMVVVRV